MFPLILVIVIETRNIHMLGSSSEFRMHAARYDVHGLELASIMQPDGACSRASFFRMDPDQRLHKHNLRGGIYLLDSINSLDGSFAKPVLYSATNSSHEGYC